MMPTEYSDINLLLRFLSTELQHYFNENLVGIYLFGSLAWGNFNYKTSDIDMVIVIKSDVSQENFMALNLIHKKITEEYPCWKDRIEIAYVSLNSLQNCKTFKYNIALISPGEPFNIKEASADWMINFYLLQNNNIVVFGPDPKIIIDPIAKSDFNRLRFVICTHRAEWESAKNFRNKYFFEPNKIEDPYTWTFDHKNHKHFILYQGTDIVGYAHIQLWPENRAAIRIIVIDEEHQGKGYGKEFIALIEKWLKLEGYKSIHTESSPTALKFYKRLHYEEMPFNDPDGYECGPEDIAMGKLL